MIILKYLFIVNDTKMPEITAINSTEALQKLFKLEEYNKVKFAIAINKIDYTTKYDEEI